MGVPTFENGFFGFRRRGLDPNNMALASSQMTTHKCYDCAMAADIPGNDDNWYCSPCWNGNDEMCACGAPKGKGDCVECEMDTAFETMDPAEFHAKWKDYMAKKIADHDEALKQEQENGICNQCHKRWDESKKLCGYDDGGHWHNHCGEDDDIICCECCYGEDEDEDEETEIECSVRQIRQMCDTDKVVIHPYSAGDETKRVVSGKSAEVWFGSKGEEEEWMKVWTA